MTLEQGYVVHLRCGSWGCHACGGHGYVPTKGRDDQRRTISRQTPAASKRATK